MNNQVLWGLGGGKERLEAKEEGEKEEGKAMGGKGGGKGRGGGGAMA